MSEKPGVIHQTLGNAIDELIQALTPLDEPSRLTAIRATCEHLKIVLGPTKPTPSPSGGGTPIPGNPPGSTIVDIRSLKEEKNPKAATEMAALVAFFLSELTTSEEKKSEVDLEDMIKYFKQANFPLPKEPRFLLVNAKNAGYLDATGSGKYKLNAVGYNLVAHNLPRVNQGEKSTISKKPKKSTPSRRTKKPRR